mmetsp:Transcript_10456/g.33590  ORF Transcript_10456/g.33590 Transcript_10456/m.33590 type:complete len:202 (+) Transcript_10456:27-632(+)
MSAAARAAAPSVWSLTTRTGRLRVPRVRKQILVDMMSRKMADRSLVAVAHTGNLTYEQSALLKREVQSAGGSIHVVKNSLLGLGMRNAGLDALVPLLRGKVAVAVGDDEVALAQTLLGASKKVPDFFVLGAVLQSRRVLRHTEVERLAKLPPAEVVYSNLVSQMLPGRVLRVPNPAAHLVALLGHHSSGGDADGGGGGERE